MDLFENFLQGKMSFEEVIATTEGMLLQRQVEPENVGSAMRTILHRLQGLEAEVDENNDVIFIDIYMAEMLALRKYKSMISRSFRRKISIEFLSNSRKGKSLIKFQRFSLLI